jgi:hypothetical protein
VKNEFINQYSHTWRVFTLLVKDFDEEAWLHTGRKTIIPARLSLHILHSTKYYLQDQSEIIFPSGKAFDINWETAREDELPSRNDIISCIEDFSRRTERWLNEIDFSAPNDAFSWAGKTKLGVVIFLLRHSLYHLGELASLLNESRNGDVEDNYVKA